MPLWKIYHPVGAYSAEDKKEFAVCKDSDPEILRRDDF
jgi:hypothetical protein